MPFALPLPHRILSKALAATALALPLLMPAGVQAREFVSLKGNAVNVREIQRELKASGVELTKEADPATTGPEHITLVDPDGNPVLIDQHR